MSKTANEILDEKIRKLRVLKDVPQLEVAYALGYKSSGIMSQIERGITGMKTERIYRAAKYFGVPPAALMMDIEMSETDLKMLIHLMDMIKSNKKSKYYDTIASILELSSKE